MVPGRADSDHHPDRHLLPLGVSFITANAGAHHGRLRSFLPARFAELHKQIDLDILACVSTCALALVMPERWLHFSGSCAT